MLSQIMCTWLQDWETGETEAKGGSGRREETLYEKTFPPVSMGVYV